MLHERLDQPEPLARLEQRIGQRRRRVLPQEGVERRGGNAECGLEPGRDDEAHDVFGILPQFAGKEGKILVHVVLDKVGKAQAVEKSHAVLAEPREFRLVGNGRMQVDLQVRLRFGQRRFDWPGQHGGACLNDDQEFADEICRWLVGEPVASVTRRMSGDKDGARPDALAPDLDVGPLHRRAVRRGHRAVHHVASAFATRRCVEI